MGEFWLCMPFADYIVHEATHAFHNCKRATVACWFETKAIRSEERGARYAQLPAAEGSGRGYPPQTQVPLTASRQAISSVGCRLRVGDAHSTSRAADGRRVFGIDKHRVAAFGISTPRTDDGLRPQYPENQSLAARSSGCPYDRLWPGL